MYLTDTTASRLSKALLERGLSQANLLKLAEPFCERASIALQETDLSQYVSGTSVPTGEKIYVLALALNVNEAWLMGYNVPMERDVAPEIESEPGEKTVALYTRLSRMTLEKRERTSEFFLSLLDKA